MSEQQKNTENINLHESHNEEEIDKPIKDNKIKELKDIIGLQENLSVSNEVQMEIGKLINLLDQLEQFKLNLKKSNNIQKFINTVLIDKQENYIAESEKNLENLIEKVYIALNLVVQPNPKIVTCRQIRREIEYKVRKKNNFILGSIFNIYKYFIHSTSTPIKVICGLLMALPLYILLPIITVNNIELISSKTYFVGQSITKGDSSNINNASNEKTTTDNVNTANNNQIKSDLIDYQENIALIILAGSAGALGSVISILTRIKEYDSDKYEDALLPVIIGAFKPIIGASFGILLLTLISSNTLPIKVDENVPGKKQYFYYSVAFIIGFSERFARDIVSRAERAFIGDTDNNTSSHIPNQNNSEKDIN
jgi:hypothetical protein